MIAILKAGATYVPLDLEFPKERLKFIINNAAIKLIKQLRKEGISCIKTTEKVGKSLEYANAQSIPYVIFLGQDEVQKERFKLKNMISGDEKFLTEKQLIRALK